MTVGTVFSGHVVQLAVHFDAPADRKVLQSMEAALIAWPSSCRNGTCRTCICQLSSGSVRYTIDWPGLSADEKTEGYILPCVAYPTSDLVL
jgi:ferredoxin